MLKPTVLIVDDEKPTREGLRAALEDRYDVYIAEDGEGALRLLEEDGYDVLLTDLRMPGIGGLDLIKRAKSLGKPPICILMTAYGSEEMAVDAMRQGADDYIAKGRLQIDELEMRIARAVRSQKLESENRELRSQVDTKFGLENVIGQSSAMEGIFEIVQQVAPARASVLVLGESGTGKELAARAIHQLGDAKDGRFVALDLAALPASEINRQLFGADGEPGAVHQKGGTLYLDEIGDLPAEAQTQLVKLMRDSSGARIIASTRRNLSRLVDEGKFREDLYYRLNVVRLNMPPLRLRKEDIPELARAFLIRAQRQGLAAKTLDKSALDLLTAYDWPGNVRELENLVLRLAVLCPDETITLRDVERELRAGASEQKGSSAGFEKDVETLLHRYVMGDLIASTDEEGSSVYSTVVDQVERPLIRLALSVTAGNKVKAAQLLGMNRNTLRAKINALGIADE